MKKKAVQSLIALCLCSSLIVGCGNTVVQSKPTIETTEETETAPEVIKYSEDEIRSIAKNNGLVRSYDDFDEVSFYYANYEMHQLNNTQYYCGISNGMYLYIANKGETVALKCVLKYTGYSWIFFDNVTFKVGTEMYEYDIPYSDVKRDTTSDAKVYERYSFTSDDSFIEVIKAIREARSCSIRFKGDDKQNTIDLTLDDINAMSDVLDTYEEIIAGKTQE